MPLRIADLAKTEKTVTLQYEGQSVTVVYRPKLVTHSTRLRLMGGPNLVLRHVEDVTISQMADALQDNYALFASLLVSWDVLDERGKPLKTTPEIMATLPDDFLGSVFMAIVEDGAPSPRTGGDSPGTSPATG